MALVQKIKNMSFIKTSKYIVYISFVISMATGILFSLSFTDISAVNAVWVGFFSFIEADSLYKMFEDKIFKSFSSQMIMVLL